LAVYLHFPFCASRCPYCDFAVSVRPQIPHGLYADAVLAELAARADGFGARPLGSIFVGGGTPSMWSAPELARVLRSIAERFDAGGALERGELEVTVEANPGDLSGPTLAGLRASGVNRLSIGAQAFDDETLVALGRRHSAEQARAAVPMARAAGFTNVSVDVMFSVPTESSERWSRTLDVVVELDPEHASLYQLTIEQGTPFAAQRARGLLPLPWGEGERAAELYEQARSRLEAAGYELYEISNYARPGARCRHNLQYWRGGQWLGLGVSAVSQWAVEGGVERVRVTRNVDEYLARAGAEVILDGRELLSSEEALAERIWLGLRVVPEGLDRKTFLAELGVDPLTLLAPRLDPLVRAGWVEVTPDRLRLTRAGVLVADEVAVRLVP
jgi:oxygen-independent coproporphyrinogen-3 oxidase